MKKGIFALLTILLLCSCVIEVTETETTSDYVGTWEMIITSTNKQVIKIKSSSYTVTEITYSAITGDENGSTELETGTLSEVNLTTLEFVSTGVYALGDFQEVGVLSEAAYTRNVVWVLNGDELTLAETSTIPNSFVSGTYTKQ